MGNFNFFLYEMLFSKFITLDDALGTYHFSTAWGVTDAGKLAGWHISSILLGDFYITFAKENELLPNAVMLTSLLPANYKPPKLY